MAEKGRESDKGTLIRGADGALYFVEDDDKWARRLPDDLTADARALLDKEGFVAKERELPAFHGSGLLARRYASEHEVGVDLNRLAILIGLKKKNSK
jgi:hypothetical protein